jgi:hypothetical protein
MVFSKDRMRPCVGLYGFKVGPEMLTEGFGVGVRRQLNVFFDTAKDFELMDGVADTGLWK